MINRKITKKYYFSVEGETEQWYLKWLQNTINSSDKASCKVSNQSISDQPEYKWLVISN